jgi:ribosomal protein L14E/L6E/L27E
MSNFSAEVGRVVQARAGRDKDKTFMIYQKLDEDYVTIVDGRTRKLEQPKKKKLKHLYLKPFVLDEIRDKIVEKKPVFDAEIRKKLDSLGFEK